MDRAAIQGWLDRYVEAWRRNEPEPIRALFHEDAVYRYRPHPGGKVLEGRDEIVAGWLQHEDAPDAWDASYEVFAVEGDRAVATGVSRYFGSAGGDDETFYNCFLLRFARDGRCLEYTEYWMRTGEEA